MKCQICGEELDQGSTRIIRLIEEIDDYVDIDVCGYHLKAAEEYLLVKARVCNRRGGLEADLAAQRKELKKI